MRGSRSHDTLMLDCRPILATRHMASPMLPSTITGRRQWLVHRHRIVSHPLSPYSSHKLCTVQDTGPHAQTRSNQCITVIIRLKLKPRYIYRLLLMVARHMHMGHLNIIVTEAHPQMHPMVGVHQSVLRGPKLKQVRRCSRTTKVVPATLKNWATDLCPASARQRP